MVIETIKDLFNSNKLSNDEWTIGWEKNKNYMNVLQEDYDPLNPSRLALGLIRSKSKVLSCGCGAGREVKFLVEQGCKVTALDHSKNMIDLSKKLEQKAKYVLGDMVTFQSKEKFDYVICLWNTINFIETKELRKEFIENCYKNLKPNGKLIILTKHAFANFGSMGRKLFSKRDFYFHPKQVDYWFKDTAFKVSKVDIKVNILIVAKKGNL